MTKRIPVIAGNWKMNMTLSQAKELADGIRFGLRHPGDVDVIVAPTYVCLSKMVELLKESYIGVAAQNLHWKDSGAFTGEISGPFIKDVGADYVIIGHSERRQLFGETDETVNKKTKAAFNCGLTPIFCIGETLDERESGQVSQVLQRQVTAGLEGITNAEANTLIVAYEPVWAIGTGKTASPAQAEEAHVIIRSLLSNLYGQATAEAIRILYGGSVKPSNATQLMALPNVDGALIGGASLKASDFTGIIACTK